MNEWSILAFAFLWGLPVAWAFGKYMINVTARRPLAAALWDFTIMAMAMGITVTWLESGNHLVLFAYAAGNAVGTYLVTRYGHKED